MSVAEAPDVPFVNTLDPAFDFESPAVAEARERNWFARTPVGFLVLRHAEVQSLLRDQRLVQNGVPFMTMNGITDGPLFDWFTSSILNLSGPAHTRHRVLISKAFTPAAMRTLRPAFHTTIQGLADELAAVRDDCEFFADFGDQLPVRTMTHLLGVPLEDATRIFPLTSGIGEVFNLAEGPEVRRRVEGAVVALLDYVDELVERRRRQPADDVVSALIAAQEDGDRLSAAELRNLLSSIIGAAQDTTRRQMARALVAFAQHPDQWRLLARQPELAPQAVEEVARWCSVTPGIHRFAGTDFDYQGVHFQTGAFLTLAVAQANRDPRVFPGGETFDITAKRSGTHFTFSGGAHYCVGAVAARMSMAEALIAMTERLGPPVITEPVEWTNPLGLYGPARLRLRFA